MVAGTTTRFVPDIMEGIMMYDARVPWEIESQQGSFPRGAVSHNVTSERRS